MPLFSRRRLIGLILAVAVGGIVGVGGYTFIYAEGGSYVTNNPAACANCHVMQSHYDAWIKSSHRNVATCNDCHTPHDPLRKYATKALNGFNHSLAFTTGQFHEPIQISDRNRAIAENACRHCHADMVQMIDRHGEGESALDCIRCHADVGHPR
jgi:cytochrome c nitrite reductase small subunit